MDLVENESKVFKHVMDLSENEKKEIEEKRAIEFKMNRLKNSKSFQYSQNIKFDSSILKEEFFTKECKNMNPSLILKAISSTHVLFTQTVSMNIDVYSKDKLYRCYIHVDVFATKPIQSLKLTEEFKRIMKFNEFIDTTIVLNKILNVKELKRKLNEDDSIT